MPNNYKLELTSDQDYDKMKKHARSIGYCYYDRLWAIKYKPEYIFVDPEGDPDRKLRQTKDRYKFINSKFTEISIEQFLTIPEYGGEIKMNKIDSLKQDIDSVKERLRSMEETLNNMECKKDSGWGDGVKTDWSIRMNGVIDKLEIMGRLHSVKCAYNNNAFTTREKAEEIAFKQNMFRKLQRFADENNDNEALYWSIFWNDEAEEVEVQKYFRTYKDFGGVYFSSYEIAYEAINLYKTDLIKYFK